MTETRKVYKPEEKLQIVLEGMSGTIQISDLCRKYGIQSSRFYDWKDKLLKSSANIFDDRGRKSTADLRTIEEQRRELSTLRETVTELVTENLQLKKNIGNYRGKT